jgi:hypothetical protein
LVEKYSREGRGFMCPEKNCVLNFIAVQGYAMNKE